MLILLKVISSNCALVSAATTIYKDVCKSPGGFKYLMYSERKRFATIKHNKPINDFCRISSKISIILSPSFKSYCSFLLFIKDNSVYFKQPSIFNSIINCQEIILNAPIMSNDAEAWYFYEFHECFICVLIVRNRFVPLLPVQIPN